MPRRTIKFSTREVDLATLSTEEIEMGGVESFSIIPRGNVGSSTYVTVTIDDNEPFDVRIIVTGVIRIRVPDWLRGQAGFYRVKIENKNVTAGTSAWVVWGDIEVSSG